MYPKSATRIGELVAACILIPWVWFAGFFRWLIGSAPGGLALALTAYFFLKHFGSSKPFTPSELLAWFADQSYEIKLGIFGALLTMLGFAIAFWTASAAWRRQKELELRVEAHKAILARFQHAIRSLNEASAYLHMLIGTLKTITPQVPLPQIAQRLAFANSRAAEFAKWRQQIYAAMLNVYDLHGEYGVIFANVIAVTADLKRAASAIEAAQDKLAEISPPHADPTDPNFVQAFLAQCSLEIFGAAHAECERARDVASTLYGKAAGVLISAIVRPNLLGLINFTRMGRTVGKITLLGRVKN